MSAIDLSSSLIGGSWHRFRTPQRCGLHRCATPHPAAGTDHSGHLRSAGVLSLATTFIAARRLDVRPLRIAAIDPERCWLRLSPPTILAQPWL